MARQQAELRARAEAAAAGWPAAGLPGDRPPLFQCLLAWDCACVLAMNRLLAYPLVSTAARCISRLGNGELWGALLLAVALAPGDSGLRCALQLLAASALGLAIYKLVKLSAARARPCVRLAGLKLCTAPLDEHSFPSGHVLHAVSFAVIVTAYFPALGLLLVPFAVLTALVRVVLGLHYPTDVAAGVLIGLAVAALSFVVFPTA
jgi:undecaprenyl-diphosphatase